ncbi:uncharacterized protein RCC_08791 [Ramularia collo-cygni]|uniref:Uncharacterized protein n=1 Tax=Ramularia collo-cygni TaxID=112498 RepID=A0A2D3VG15_9PEZI|nr:uncharacterized protein RCC_08791 [Ramularia collo-cygni]CZT23081.1 uncharacterized protein RCC_08791 [Ramularia collo-cygni]
MSSAARVFGTAELTEMILLHLPNKSILGATRACTAFAAAYKTSKSIRRKLFMEDCPWIGCETIQENPYDAEFFEEFQKRDFRGQKMHLNPLCFRDVGCIYARGEFRGDREIDGVWLHLAGHGVDYSYVHPESSCFKMMICQPNIPVSGGDVTIHYGPRPYQNYDEEQYDSVHLSASKNLRPTLGDFLRIEQEGYATLEEEGQSMSDTDSRGGANLFPHSRFVSLDELPWEVLPQLEGVDLLDAYWSQFERAKREKRLRERVFSTRKLAKKILLNLSMDELFLARQTAPVLRRAIDKSTTIKRKMFLDRVTWTGPGIAPYSEDEVSRMSPGPRCTNFITRNPEKSIANFYDVHLNPMLFSKDIINARGGRLVLNPSLKQRIQLEVSDDAAGEWTWERESLCLRMVLSSPYVPGMQVMPIKRIEGDRKYGQAIKLKDEPLRTLGHVLSAMREGLDRVYVEAGRKRAEYRKLELRMMFPEGCRFWLNGKAVNDRVADEDEDDW